MISRIDAQDGERVTGYPEFGGKKPGLELLSQETLPQNS
jgi:hypothetical protein